MSDTESFVEVPEVPPQEITVNPEPHQPAQEAPQLTSEIVAPPDDIVPVAVPEPVAAAAADEDEDEQPTPVPSPVTPAHQPTPSPSEATSAPENESSPEESKQCKFFRETPDKINERIEQLQDLIGTMHNNKGNIFDIAVFGSPNSNLNDVFNSICYQFKDRDEKIIDEEFENFEFDQQSNPVYTEKMIDTGKKAKLNFAKFPLMAPGMYVNGPFFSQALQGYFSDGDRISPGMLDLVTPPPNARTFDCLIICFSPEEVKQLKENPNAEASRELQKMLTLLCNEARRRGIPMAAWLTNLFDFEQKTILSEGNRLGPELPLAAVGQFPPEFTKEYLAPSIQGDSAFVILEYTSEDVAYPRGKQRSLYRDLSIQIAIHSALMESCAALDQQAEQEQQQQRLNQPGPGIVDALVARLTRDNDVTSCEALCALQRAQFEPAKAQAILDGRVTLDPLQSRRVVPVTLPSESLSAPVGHEDAYDDYHRDLREITSWRSPSEEIPVPNMTLIGPPGAGKSKLAALLKLQFETGSIVDYSQTGILADESDTYTTKLLRFRLGEGQDGEGLVNLWDCRGLDENFMPSESSIEAYLKGQFLPGLEMKDLDNVRPGVSEFTREKPTLADRMHLLVLCLPFNDWHNGMSEEMENHLKTWLRIAHKNDVEIKAVLTQADSHIAELGVHPTKVWTDMAVQAEVKAVFKKFHVKPKPTIAYLAQHKEGGPWARHDDWERDAVACRALDTILDGLHRNLRKVMTKERKIRQKRRATRSKGQLEVLKATLMEKCLEEGIVIDVDQADELLLQHFDDPCEAVRSLRLKGARLV